MKIFHYLGKPLFHRVILTSGTDYCEWSFIGETYGATAYNYARELGRQVGCDPGYWVTTEQLVQCLRRKHFDEIVNASANVYKMVCMMFKLLIIHVKTK